MASSVYAKRYAQAAFEMAQEKQELNVWQADLRKVAGLARDEAVFSLLDNREVAFEEKAKTLAERLGDVHPEVMKMVSMLVAKGRLAMMDDISDEYQQLMDGHRGVEGVATAEVTTAVPLDEAERLKIAQRITGIIGRPVVLKPIVDPAVIGGMIIRVGDQLIDGSVRSRLATLKRDLGGSR
jgi:F-type H+-transporting ATPase subunit delta